MEARTFEGGVRLRPGDLSLRLGLGPPSARPTLDEGGWLRQKADILNNAKATRLRQG